MEKSPVLISVIMPVYNNAKFLKEAIDSVLQQSYPHFELIIINDGSTDDSEKIILSYHDERINYVVNTENKGLVYTLNKALQLAKGKYIARMDGDDICLPKRFEKQLKYLEQNNEVVVLASLINNIDEHNNDLGFWNDDFNNVSQSSIKAFMPKLNCMAHPSVMMRADVVKKYNYQSYKNAEDWGLWLNVLSDGYKIAKLNEVLLHYRIHSASMSNHKTTNPFNRMIRFKWDYLILKLSRFQLKKYDLKVFTFLCKDIFKYKLSFLFALFVKYKETHLIELVRQYKAFKQYFAKPIKNEVIFFFPFYHIGGAEIVHTEIVKASAHKKPLVLFTNYSSSSYILDLFKEQATVLKIEQLLVWPFIRKWVTKHFVEQLKTNHQIKLFSSNSKYYYSLLQSIPQHTKAFDLIHAFMHKHELDSPENWSLPVIDKLTKRIIINNKTKIDFEKLYHEQQISPQYLNNITYISNFVEQQPKRQLIINKTFNVLYVGRGTSEKRVDLIARVAKELSLLNTAITFHFVGDVANTIPEELKQYCVLHGELSDRKKISEIYNQCHALILASEREGFPLVIMEAMMHSLIPITTNVGGISDHVNSTNGILINDTENELILQNFIKEINKLHSDMQRMSELRNNAYLHAQTHFNKELFYSSYKQLFS